MPYDEAGNYGPDGIGMYDDRTIAIQAGRERSELQSAAARAAYERARSGPTSLSTVLMLGVLAVAAAGNAAASALGVSFDTAVWLMIGMAVVGVIATRFVMKRLEASEQRKAEARAQAWGTEYGVRAALMAALTADQFRFWAKTSFAFVAFAAVSLSILSAVGFVESALGVALTSPLWLGWGMLASSLAFTEGMLSRFLRALEHLTIVIQMRVESSLQAVALKFAESGAGVRLSAVPEMLARWHANVLEGPVGKGVTGRVARGFEKWIMRSIRARVLGALQRGTRSPGAQMISVPELSRTVASVATAAVSGPLKRRLGFARWLASTAMFLLWLTTGAVYLLAVFLSRHASP